MKREMSTVWLNKLTEKEASNHFTAEFYSLNDKCFAVHKISKDLRKHAQLVDPNCFRSFRFKIIYQSSSCVVLQFFLFFLKNLHNMNETQFWIIFLIFSTPILCI